MATVGRDSGYGGTDPSAVTAQPWLLATLSVISVAAVLWAPPMITITLPFAVLAGGLHRSHRLATAGVCGLIQVGAFLLSIDAHQLEAGIG